jgi:hypothetical protein
VTNAVATGSVGTVTYRFEVSESDAFTAGSRTSTSLDIPQGDGTTTWLPPSELIPDFLYYWHARATNGTITSEWSKTETFKTQNKGFFNGQNVYDPLTNGVTVGRRVGGHFVPGDNGGWQADGLYDALDYDMSPTCQSCRVEFDATNFGRGEGTPISIDVKWFSMGDIGSWGSFGAFRDSPWKMHLEQRSDGDGTGMQVIWRNGSTETTSGGDMGDHRGKFLSGGPPFHSSQVFHFVIEWTQTTYSISINGVRYFPGAGDSGVFRSGNPYAPPNHRIELGCTPRGESMPGARYRKVRITPQ